MLSFTFDVKKTCSVVVCMFFYFSPFAQPTEEKIILSKVVGSMPFNRGYVASKRIKDSTIFKGIPVWLKDYMIKFAKVVSSSEESDYQKYAKGKLDVESFIKLYPKTKIDLNDKSRALSKRGIYLLVGEDRDGSRVIIVDADHDRDFSNDRVFKFVASPQSLTKNERPGWFTRDDAYSRILDSLPSLNVPIESFDGEKFVVKELTIKCNPYNSGFGSPNTREERLYADIYINEYRSGTFISGNKKYKVAVSNTWPTPVFQTVAKLVFLFGEDHNDGVWEKPNGPNGEFNLGDLLAAEDFNYQLTSVSTFGDTLTLSRKLKGEKATGNGPRMIKK